MCSIILGVFRFSGRDWNHHNRQYDRSKRKFFERNATAGILVEHAAIQRSSKFVVQRNNVIDKP